VTGIKTYGARNGSDKRTAIRQILVSMVVLVAVVLLAWAFLF
jgi:hypothetical protein